MKEIYRMFVSCKSSPDICCIFSILSWIYNICWESTSHWYKRRSEAKVHEKLHQNIEHKLTNLLAPVFSISFHFHDKQVRDLFVVFLLNYIDLRYLFEVRHFLPYRTELNPPIGAHLVWQVRLNLHESVLRKLFFLKKI